MQVSFLTQNNTINSISFCGKFETFWKIYNKNSNSVLLKDTIIKSINDDSNLLGEGLNKKGYLIDGIKEYIIRIYKNNFKLADLNSEFLRPRRNYADTVDGVALRIPDKIDIVKRKKGESIGVKEYGVRICPPMDNISITREESLKSLKLYEKIKDFPLDSYRKAYSQIKLFCSKQGYQFDIVNPNNILIDTKTKKINFIDPMDPKINKCEEKPVDFSKYHGYDSLYPVLCDFLMHKEHLNNLNKIEKQRWIQSIKTIITKCIIAGKDIGLEKSSENLKFLYNRIDKLWYTQGGVPSRYKSFMTKYADTANQANIISDALNCKKQVAERISAIGKINSDDFEFLKPIFKKLIKAPHQPKVEIPEILNAILDKLSDFGKKVAVITPTLETLFDKEIFFTTKKRLYNLFIAVAPDNKRFLNEIMKSANNPIERILYEQEFKKLNEQLKNVSKKTKNQIMLIYEASKNKDEMLKDLASKLWISRTCTNTNPAQKLSIENMIKAYQYIESKKHEIPKTKDLVTLHKIVLKDTPGQEAIIGNIRTKETEYLFNQIFNVKKIPKKAVNPYADSKDVLNELQRLDKYIEENYNNEDVYNVAAKIFFDIVWIHPFYNGNGRVSRLFTEKFLLSKGIRLISWPEETLYRKIYSTDELAEKLKQNSKYEHEVIM